MKKHAIILAATTLALLGTSALAKNFTLLNVSYDPTRELYKQINAAFAADYKAKTGDTVTINQSHGGSGGQARAVIDGLGADVVTLAISADIDAISKNSGALPANWQTRLPHNSSPYTSTIVFVVRKGNPWKIKDWGDLVKPGIQVVTSNPKVSGGGRWAYLAAWAYAAHRPNATDASAKAFEKALYSHVPVLDAGARASTLTFAQRNIGDVYLSWENEAYLVQAEFGADKFDIVTPPSSILAEPPVALVDKMVDKHGTRAVADAYLKFLYTKPAQEIEVKNHYRPIDPEIFAAHAKEFPAIKLYTIDQDFGGWAKVQATHFADGGIFDQIIVK